MDRRVFHADRIFDGRNWHDDAALIVESGLVVDITSTSAAERLPGWIVPGLVDLQVNGGGGVLFNNAPTAETLARIVAAHASFGTTAVMATLISDTAEVTTAAIAAVKATTTKGVLGLHLEGPHLDILRKGTHDPALIRRMTDEDLARLLQAAADLPHLICTIAPESVSLAQVRALAAAGVVVSLGHSDCSHVVAQAYMTAGARMVTHLFNAMSQMQHRAPGLVGAGLEEKQLWTGIIADGFHVDDAVLKIALRAKKNLFLVSDAMSTIGSEQSQFTLNGRQIFRSGGRLTLADGTLAGADIALIDAVRYVHRSLGLPLDRALRLAAMKPAQSMGLADRGHLEPGARADFFCMSAEITSHGCWIGGEQVA